MYKTLSLLGIFFILSCGNENKSKLDNKKNSNKNEKINRDINKNNLTDDNKNDSSLKNDFIEVGKIKKEKETIKKAKWFFIYQRSNTIMILDKPVKNEREAKDAIFVISTLTSELKFYFANGNSLKNKIEVKEYDPNNFFTFLELFRLEEIERKKNSINKFDEGNKYILKFKEEILNTRDSEDFLGYSFFNNDYIINEVIKRIKKLDNEKFKEDISMVEKYRRFNINTKFNELGRDFKREVSKIFDKIIDEARTFIPKIKFELIEEHEDKGIIFIIEITYKSNGEENSFTKFLK